MPTTTNYGWSDPTPGGSTGTWDDILNALFQEIDDEVFRVEGLIGPGLAAQYNVLAVAGSASDWAASGFDSAPGQVMVATPAGILDGKPLNIGIAPLRVGQRITSFRSCGLATGGGAFAQVRLCYLANATGVRSVVDSGHTLPSSVGSTETVLGSPHDVVADRTYFIEVTPGASNENAAAINMVLVSVTVIPTP